MSTGSGDVFRRAACFGGKGQNAGVVHQDEIQNKAKKFRVLGGFAQVSGLSAGLRQKMRQMLGIVGEKGERLSGEGLCKIGRHGFSFARKGFVNRFRL